MEEEEEEKEKQVESRESGITCRIEEGGKIHMHGTENMEDVHVWSVTNGREPEGVDDGRTG